MPQSNGDFATIEGAMWILLSFRVAPRKDLFALPTLSSAS